MTDGRSKPSSVTSSSVATSRRNESTLGWECTIAPSERCSLIPRLNALRFTGALSPEHEGINRVHVGVVHGALGKELHEWRPPQAADFVRIRGAGRYAPGQTQDGAMADLRRELDALEARFPGLKAVIVAEHETGQPLMPSYEVDRNSRIVQAINEA